MTNTNKIFGLDLLRALAIVSVLAGHFFLNTKFASATFNTPSLLIQGCVQYLFTSIGVPLFLMLTGYLNCRKQLEWSYYPRIRRVLVDYLAISVVTYLIMNFRSGYSALAFIKGVLAFHTINYAWYIEMYIGLFLLIPFLNVLWRGLTESESGSASSALRAAEDKSARSGASSSALRATEDKEQSRAEQSRAEQSRAEQSRAEQSRAEQSRAEQSRAERFSLSALCFCFR